MGCEERAQLKRIENEWRAILFNETYSLITLEIQMIIKSLRFILALIYSISYIQATQPVSVTKNDITITARAMTKGQCLDTFYQDVHSKHIYPVVLSVTNNSDKAMVFSSDHTKIPNATILTPKTIDAEISTLDTSTFFFAITIALMPLSIATSYLAGELRVIKPIIDRFSSGDNPITIEPGATFKTIVFVKIDYPKDAEGKTLSYVAPQSLTLSTELRSSSSWFHFNSSNHIFELIIPTLA